MQTNPSLLTVLSWWSFDPTIWLGVAVAAILYVAGLRELGRRGRLRRTVADRHIAYFGLGLLSIVLALESPIDTLSLYLFSAHMVQHMLLLMVAPPLLLLGKPIPVLLVGTPHSLARWVARAHARTSWLHWLTKFLTAPFVAWALYAGALLAWHTPSLYQAALRNTGVHLLEHLSYLFAGILFWWVVIEPLPGPARLAPGWRLTYVLTALAPGMLLGGLFSMDGTPIYSFYAGTPRLWGFSVLADQGMAGFIMLILGDGMLLVAAIPLFAGMMEQFEQRELARFARLEDASNEGISPPS